MHEMNLKLGVHGHIKIWNPETNEVFVDKDNAIHYENFSVALAQSLANKGTNFISEMHFGNGGTSIDPTGVISYLPPNSEGVNADLYSPTYYKLVDDNSLINPDSLRNKMQVRPVTGKNYSDILVTCLLDYGEPNDQAAFDNSQNLSGAYVFDELGLKGFLPNAPGQGPLLTHVVFHPVQKSLNRLIQIDYTIRISTLTNLNFIG